MTGLYRSYRKESRDKDWGTKRPGISLEQINAGSLLRIADATEKMCKDREQLERTNTYFSQSNKRLRDELAREQRSNAALRGHLKRVKNQRDEMSNMLKVFRGCIKTQFLPARDGKCEKKVIELVGDEPNEPQTGR